VFALVVTVDPQIDAVQGLIKRLIPQHLALFDLELLHKHDNDRFELESVANKVITKAFIMF
jgi:hypothetical protein